MSIKLSINKRLSNWIVAAFILYLFYYSYRYILKYNAEMTSPTYSDTPFALQVGKYIILAILLVGMFFAVLNKKIKPLATLPYILLVIMLLQCLYSFFVAGNINDIIFIICFFPALIIMSGANKIDVSKIDKVCNIFLYFTIIYEIIQILMYVIFGRLPALGYDTGVITDVRFGGAWDDPNGFSVILAFLIPYAYHKFRSIKRVIIVGLLSIFLLMTWSLTGIASCIIVFTIILISKAIHYQKYTIKTFAKIVAVLIILFLGIIFICVFMSDAIYDFIQSKMGSIIGHLDSFDLSRISPEIFWGIYPAPRQMESGVIALIFHGGIIHLIAFYIIGIISILSCYKILKRTHKTNKYYSFYYGIICYLSVFLLANINLPMVYLFSNVGIFALFAAISINNKFFQYEILYKHPIMQPCVNRSK